MISFPWGASPPNPPLHGLRGLRGPVVRGLRGRVAVPGGVRCWLRQKGDSVLTHVILYCMIPAPVARGVGPFYILHVPHLCAVSAGTFMAFVRLASVGSARAQQPGSPVPFS